MPKPVIVSAVRTAIGTSFKGSLVNTTPEFLATTILQEVVKRSGVDVADIDDVIFAESHYGGGDMARYAASASGMTSVPGQAVNRHCAGSLTAVANAAAQIGSGAEKVVVGGGVQSLSMTPMMNWRIPGPTLEFEERWIPPTHVETPDAPGRDMSIRSRVWRRAVAVYDSDDELAHSRSDPGIRGAVDSADPCGDPRCAGPRHVDHGRVAHRASRRDQPRRDGCA